MQTILVSLAESESLSQSGVPPSPLIFKIFKTNELPVFGPQNIQDKRVNGQNIQK
jgi:hypothetical protein